MDSFLGIPTEGWKALSIWLAVIVFPWTYSLYMLRRIDKSGVARWGSRYPKYENKEVAEEKGGIL